MSIQKKSPKQKYAELFLVLASILFSLFITEGILRVFFAKPFPLANYYYLDEAKLGKTIHIKQYEFDTWYRFNSAGFRDKEISINKTRGTKRILFVGDSFTEGFGVEETERFSNRLIDKLGGNYEAINVGQIATNPNTYFDNIVKFGIALKPDIIVMGIFLGNDFMGMKNLPLPVSYKVVNSIKRSNEQPLKGFVSLEYVRALLSQIGKKDKILIPKLDVRDKNFWDMVFRQHIDKQFYANQYKLSTEQLDKVTSGFNKKIVQEIYNGRIHSAMFDEGINNQLKKKPDSGPYYAEDDYLKTYAYIEESNRVALSHGIKFLALIIPDIYQVHPAEFKNTFAKNYLVEKVPSRLIELKKIHSRLVNDLSKNGIPHVDVTGALIKNGSLAYYMHDNHMNKTGHEIISRELLPIIRSFHIGSK